MSRRVKVVLIIAISVIAYSLIPVICLYVRPEPPPYSNRQTINKLSANKGEYFEFIVMSDIQSGLIFNDSAGVKIIRNINREDRFRKAPIDFTMITGDLTFRGSQWDYGVYNKIRSMVKTPVISAIGNHDDDRGGLARFRRYVGEDEFSFRDRNSYFIVLNTIENDMTEAQFVWFENELKASASSAHRFVALHKPPISPYQQSWYKPEHNPWAYRFMKLCQKYRVDMVFSGHEHIFKDGIYGGVRYITTGGAGMMTQVPKSDGGFLHYVVVRVYGEYVDYEVREVFPPAWECVTYYWWKELFYTIKRALL